MEGITGGHLGVRLIGAKEKQKTKIDQKSKEVSSNAPLSQRVNEEKRKKLGLRNSQFYTSGTGPSTKGNPT